eukprot:197839-Amphidinium_carterae.1
MQLDPKIVPSNDAEQACCYAAGKRSNLPSSAGVAAMGRLPSQSLSQSLSRISRAVADLSRMCRGFVADSRICLGRPWTGCPIVADLRGSVANCRSAVAAL